MVVAVKTKLKLKADLGFRIKESVILEDGVFATTANLVLDKEDYYMDGGDESYNEKAIEAAVFESVRKGDFKKTLEKVLPKKIRIKV